MRPRQLHRGCALEKEDMMKTLAATSVDMAAAPVRVQTWSGRLVARIGAMFSRLGVTARLRLVLFILLVPPPAALLYWLESRSGTDVSQLTAIWLVLSLVLLKPLASGVSRWVALGEIAALNAFCAALRRGEYARRLPLPPQSDDEHALLLLKRDLNWMAHNIETREIWLQARLTETHQDKRLFEDLSRTDALTGLFNRRHFDSVLAEQTRQALACQTQLALLLVDCDAFKSINDRFGHSAGDAVLAGMGRVLRESVRDGADWAFRLGGDEFALVLPNLDGPSALRVARRIRQRYVDENPYKTTASIGIACLDPGRDAACPGQSLFARCDAALYQVKGRGGDSEALADGVCAAPA